MGFFSRFWLAIKYVLGYGGSTYGFWDCWCLRKEDAFRLRDLLDRYIREHGLIIENGVLKEPIRD